MSTQLRFLGREKRGGGMGEAFLDIYIYIYIYIRVRGVPERGIFFPGRTRGRGLNSSLGLSFPSPSFPFPFPFPSRVGRGRGADGMVMKQLYVS